MHVGANTEDDTIDDFIALPYPALHLDHAACLAESITGAANGCKGNSKKGLEAQRQYICRSVYGQGMQPCTS